MRFTVVIPSYRRPQFLVEALRSVLAQSHSDWELWVLDNCSQDGTEDIVRGFADKRINYICHPRNIGLHLNWKAALTAGCDEWIAMLEDDNIWKPTHLETAWKTIRAHGQSVDLVASGCRAFGDNNDWPMAAPYLRGRTDTIRWVPNSENITELLWGTPVMASTVVVRRTALANIDWGHETWPWCHDFWLWAQVILSKGFAYDPVETMLYRYHATNFTKQVMRFRSGAEYRWILRQLANRAWDMGLLKEPEKKIAAMEPNRACMLCLAIAGPGARPALRRAARALLHSGFPGPVDAAMPRHWVMAQRFGPAYLWGADFFERLRAGLWWRR